MITAMLCLVFNVVVALHWRWRWSSCLPMLVLLLLSLGTLFVACFCRFHCSLGCAAELLEDWVRPLLTL